MKKYLLLSLLCFTITADAQSLVDTNKVWNVVECYNPSPCGTTVFRFGNDTTIGNLQYKRLTVNIDSGNVFGGWIMPIAAREVDSTRQVFFYYNGDYLAYDFSLNLGDSFVTDISGCSVQMIVNSVDTIVLLNGEQRKRMVLSGNSGDVDTWVEGVGSLNGLPNIGIYACSVDYYVYLNCFRENDTLKYQSSLFTSCFVNTIGVPEIDADNKLKLIPNPFSETTTLIFENPTHEQNTLKIFSGRGQLVANYMEMTGNEVIIERGKMTAGIYYFQLMNDRRIVGNGKLIVE